MNTTSAPRLLLTDKVKKQIKDMMSSQVECHRQVRQGRWADMSHWQYLSIQADANHGLLLYHAERERVDPWTPLAACQGELPIWFKDLADHPQDLVAFLTRMRQEGWGDQTSSPPWGSCSLSMTPLKLTRRAGPGSATE